MLRKVQDSSLRMNELIDDLLKFARLGRNTLILQQIHLGDVLDVMMQTYGKRILDENAKVILPPCDPLLDICGDLTLLYQVFNNLMDNSLKYRSPNIQVVIKIKAEVVDQEMVIHFCDNGIGIATEQFDRIFNIFQRLHTTEDYPGTGIGLAIVKKAVEMMSGTISVESTPGQGTCFIIRLKVCPPESKKYGTP